MTRFGTSFILCWHVRSQGVDSLQSMPKIRIGQPAVCLLHVRLRGMAVATHGFFSRRHLSSAVERTVFSPARRRHRDECCSAANQWHRSAMQKSDALRLHAHGPYAIDGNGLNDESRGHSST